MIDMLENNESNRRNQTVACIAAGLTGIGVFALSMLSPYWWFATPLVVLVFLVCRRRTRRRLRVLSQPFPPTWETVLLTNVAFFRALDDAGRDRFRNMVKVFLDETRITGIKTDADDGTRILVAASAIIPVFGFDDWEYSGLGEVLIYPNAFSSDQVIGDSDSGGPQNTLGMVGVGYLSGVMILSKTDLWSGFQNPEDKRNVGIHEFAHLVDKADGEIDGLPPGVTHETAKPWIRWVGEELRRRKPSGNKAGSHINDYAYTNEAEYFAVLTEYFFEAPDVLKKKEPQLYEMMQSMYRQNTRSFLSNVARRPRRVGRNDPCPCGSGDKYKRCCRRKSR